MSPFKKHLIFLLIMVVFINVILAYFYQFSLKTHEYLPFLIIMIFLSLITFYFYKKKQKKIAVFFDASVFYSLSGIILALYSYEMSALNFPLMDRYFIQIDGFMGFNWMKHLLFTLQYPWFYSFLGMIYLSYIFQMFLILLVLARKYAQNHLFKVIFSFSLTAFICITISIFLPAWGAYFEAESQQHGIDYVVKKFGQYQCGDNFLCDFLALREGSLRQLTFKLHGIMTFPSFHAAGATLFALYMRHEKGFAYPAAFFNVLIIFSALSVGHHHLIDIIAGCVIALSVYGFIFKEKEAQHG